MKKLQEVLNLKINNFLKKNKIEIMDYISNTITSPEGGIYSAGKKKNKKILSLIFFLKEDADSLISFNHTKYKEGAFYVW